MSVFYFTILGKPSCRELLWFLVCERVKKTNGAHWANGMLERHISDAGAGVKTMPAFYPCRALIGRETVPPWHTVGESEGQKNVAQKPGPHHLHSRSDTIRLLSYLHILYCVLYGYNNAYLVYTHGLFLLFKSEFGSKCKQKYHNTI